jgi:hypothetical protein
MLNLMLFWKLVWAVLNLELDITTYNGIEGGETKQKDGNHEHGNKCCSIVTSNGDGTLVCSNRGGKGHWKLE